jgi:hypothetical protein
MQQPRPPISIKPVIAFSQFARVQRRIAFVPELLDHTQTVQLFLTGLNLHKNCGS